MADKFFIKYEGPSDAYSDEDVTFPKGEVVALDSSDQAEKLLGLEGENSFAEASDEELQKIEDQEAAETAAAEGAEEIEKENAEAAARTAAFYGAESQDEIDEAFSEDDTPSQSDSEVPTDEGAPEGGPVSETEEDEADSFRNSFLDPEDDR